MTRILGIVALGATMFVPTVDAQNPDRSPQLQKLDAFVGTWSFQWDAPDSIFGPAGSITGVERFSWLPGGQFLQMTREAEGIQNLALFGFDQDTQLYTQSVFNLTNGWSADLSGPESDLTWIWSGKVMVEGTEYEESCVWSVPSDRMSRTMRCEVSSDGESWVLTNEGTYTRVE